MSINLKPVLYQVLSGTLGNALVFLRPERTRQLAENRIALVHRNKKNMSIPDRLMRAALLKKLEKIQDYHVIAEQNRNFWINHSATELFSELEDTFHTDFLPHCTFIFELLKDELSKHSEEFNTIVEIGTGNGDVLNYLSSEFPEITHFIGIDLSHDQIALNKIKYKNNIKLEFVADDALEWVKKNGHDKTILSPLGVF